MSTKEIECMVDAAILDDKRIENYTLARPGATDRPRLKARLIVEVPEKKIEITESDFERIVKGYSLIDDGGNVWRDLKRELGF